MVTVPSLSQALGAKPCGRCCSTEQGLGLLLPLSKHILSWWVSQTAGLQPRVSTSPLGVLLPWERRGDTAPGEAALGSRGGRVSTADSAVLLEGRVSGSPGCASPWGTGRSPWQPSRRPPLPPGALLFPDQGSQCPRPAPVCPRPQDHQATCPVA